MKVVIDLDQHQAIQDFTIRAPAGTYQFKSQDTVEWQLYFVQGGFVIDMGASFALKFGMIKTGDTTNTLLAYTTSFIYKTDSSGNVYYSGLVNFNTSQMASAIGTLPSIQGTAEIRYQDAINEIIHTINIPTIVYATIIVETGVTPPGVSTGYPDASTIELLVHKNAASGYAGLNASSLLNGAQIPIDGQTIQIRNGQVASSPILASTAANFTTPAANGTVSVTFVSTSGLVAGQYVRIPIAGYYVVQSVTNATVAVLQNNGDPFNAASGTTITSGAVLVPAQAAAAGGGGQGAFTTTTANFTVPNPGATVQIQVVSTAWMGGNGYGMFITGAGYYLVQSILDTNNVVVTNSGSGANLPQGTIVTSGARVSAAGPMGPAGSAGSAGLAAYDALTAAFTMPAANAAVTIQIVNTAWLGANQVIYIATAGYFQVTTIVNATNATITNLNYPGAAAPGATIASGSHVGPAGLIGPQGAGGAGLNAFTTLTTGFTQPAIGSNVTVVVGTTAWMALNQGIYISGGGYYSVVTIGDLTHATVTNLGSSGNAGAGSSVASGGNVTPAGTPGTAGQNAFTTTTASYAQPTVGSTVSVTVGSTAWMVQNQYVFINGGGTYTVASIASATVAVLLSVAATGNVSSGTVVPTGSAVSPSGPAGPQGATGPQGPAGSGGGSIFDPRNGFYIYEEFLFGALASSTNSNPADAARVAYSNNGGATFFGPPDLAFANNNTYRAIGTASLQTGTAASTGAYLFYGNPVTTGSGISLGFGSVDIASRIMIDGASLPAAGNAYTLRFGLWQQNGSPGITYSGGVFAAGLPAASVFLEYGPDINSGNLRLGYGGNPSGTPTVTYINTNAAMTAGVFYWWEMIIDTSGTVKCYLNGSLILTATGVAPLGTLLAPMWGTNRTSGSANYYITVDNLYIYCAYTR